MVSVCLHQARPTGPLARARAPHPAPPPGLQSCQQSRPLRESSPHHSLIVSSHPQPSATLIPKARLLPPQPELSLLMGPGQALMGLCPRFLPRVPSVLATMPSKSPRLPGGVSELPVASPSPSPPQAPVALVLPEGQATKQRTAVPPGRQGPASGTMCGLWTPEPPPAGGNPSPGPFPFRSQ